MWEYVAAVIAERRGKKLVAEDEYQEVDQYLQREPAANRLPAQRA